EPGGLDGGPPLSGRQEAARRTVDRMQARRAEGLHEVEDELGVDRLPRVRADALRHDELATRYQGAADLAEREREVVRHVQGVDGVDHRDVTRPDPLFPERAIHVEGVAPEPGGTPRATLAGLLPGPEDPRHEPREPARLG